MSTDITFDRALQRLRPEAIAYLNSIGCLTESIPIVGKPLPHAPVISHLKQNRMMKLKKVLRKLFN